ncbi:uncharacterized protein si:ch211-106e7.2 isoform X2 [Colossoma macropomum]|uniref:uncharacterized protein si:ch211-106e7.2 isoform X2 n=1 Tax=Colossoma macropomum TaxID=42526 RepID=UPI0018655015|nr:uncharacterized protein si:ch211-106e7.2 isoform X2 [Colossoma macropomum]
MARPESEDCTSDHLNCTSDHVRKILETMLKDKQSLSHKEQTTLGSYGTRPSPSLKAMSDQMLTQPQHTSRPTLMKAQGYYNNNNNSEWVSPLGKKDSNTFHWDNSIQRPPGYPALSSGNNAHVNVMNSENLNNMHSWPHQENTVRTLPKDCIQQRKATGHANFAPSVSHQADLGSECSKKHPEVFKLPALNIQSKFENVGRIHKSVSHKRKQFFVTVSEDNTGFGFVAENVVSADELVKPDNSYTRTLDNSIRHFSGQFGKSSLDARSISAQAHQQSAFLPKENHHHKNVPQKAVAVVAPLAQHVITGAEFSQDSTKGNEGGHGTRTVPDEQSHHSYLSCPLQSRVNESLCDNEAQIHMSQEMPSESVMTTEFSQCSEPEGPVTAKELSNQSGSLSSMPVGSIHVERKESVQSSHVKDQSIAVDTAINKSYDGTETRMDPESTNRWSAVPVTKWSLQKLQTLVINSEWRQKKSQKEILLKEFLTTIINLYWGGDYRKLCEAARSDIYTNIMKEVKLHRGTKDSVILQEIPKEKFDQLAEHFHILKHDSAPTEVIQSSFSNLNEKVDDNKECGHSLSLMTFHSAPEVDVEVVERQKNMHVAENDKGEASNEASSRAMSFALGQSQPLPTVHEKKRKSVGDGILMDNNNPVRTDLKTKWTSSIRETVGQKEPLLECLSKPSTETADNCKTVTVSYDAIGEPSKPEEENQSPRNEVSLLVSLNEQSPAVSDDCVHVKPDDLLQLPATEKTPPLDDCGNSSDSSDPFAFIKIKVLSSEMAKKIAASESYEEVENIQKDVSVQTITENNDQVIVKLCDQMSEDEEHMDAKISTAESNATGELQKYCCFPKWFQVLGYATDLVCKCEKEELSSGNDVFCRDVIKEMTMTGKNVPMSPILGDASMDEIEIVDVITDYEDVLKIANAISEQLTDKPLAECGPDAFKKEKHHRPNAYQKKRTCHSPCGQIASKANLISDLSSDASQMDLALPLTFTDIANLQCDEHGRETTTTEFQKETKIVNLALYGSSELRHNRSTTTNSCAKEKGFSDEEHFPPATINVRVSPCLNNYANSNKSQTTKQRILKSWRSSHVPMKMFTDRRLKKLNSARRTESKSDAESTSRIKTGACSTAFDVVRTLLSHQDDMQTHDLESMRDKTVRIANQHKNAASQSKDKSNSTKKDKTKQKRKETLASINPNTRQKANKRKSTQSSYELPHTSSKSKQESHRDLKLDFKVLPESFNFTDGNTRMEADRSASAKCEMPGLNVKARNLKKTTLGAWCVSPRRKGHLKSTLASNVSVSLGTFQQFKRRYEEKKQRLLPKTT